MKSSTTYRVGIDVGSYSLGLAAIEIDEDNRPIKILSAMSLIHDSGLDPDKQKEAITRLASSGVARRTRRLYRRRRRRVIKLEKFLKNLGWKTLPFEHYEDSYLPWKARVELVNGFIADDAERGEKLSIALRHIANHRGWRNPYWKTRSLHNPGAPSDAFVSIREDLEKKVGRKIPENATVAQVVAFADFGNDRIRGGGKKKDQDKEKADHGDEVKQAVISARLQQVDHAREINEICRVQKIDDDLRKRIIDLVFEAESPKGAQLGRVGKDPLQPNKDRALKATDAFQRYRITALIGNLRIRDGKDSKPLSAEHRSLIFDFLVNLEPKKEPSWLDVAGHLGIDRGDLLGTATMTNDGERAGSRPPVHDTNRTILGTKVKPLAAWWKDATADARAAMLKALSNAEVEDFDSEAGVQVQEFFASLDEKEHEKLDSLHLPIGRAAYSEDTLKRLTKRMQHDNVDLHQALRLEFDIPENWAPPAPAIGEKVGNPAVDRVLKGVSRWLEAAASEWGDPESVVIEHVRDGFISESKSREIDRDMNRRAKNNQVLFKSMQENLKIEGKLRRSDLWRYQSVQRQNGQCAYCGSAITYSNCEMDHIVPRAGEGSTNTRTNLIAACSRCNRSKSNMPFAVWANQSTIPGVGVKEALERTKFWLQDAGLNTRDFNAFRNEVCQRLKRTTADEPIDNRSIESVAWMANELRARVAQRFSENDTRVNVFRGEITADARNATGITKKLKFIDGYGKSRLDRRHHAVDAAVVALTTPFVAEVLVQRRNKRDAARLTNGTDQWKEFTGSSPDRRAAWNAWLPRVQQLAGLLQHALDEDRIVVTSNLRLRLGNGRAHEDTIGKLNRIKVGAEMSIKLIDRAASEALWCALTRDPDFDPKEGLPANPERRIRIHGTWYDAEDEIEFFPGTAGCIKVRGGYAELSRFHHARIYKINSGKKPVFSMLRVYNADLARHQNEDLFNVEMKPQTMSVRQSEDKLRRALVEGTAEYIGWLVVDDELHIDPTSFTTGQVGAFQTEFGNVTRWRLDGFFSNARFRLRPLQMSAEGLNKDASDVAKKILDRPGWTPAVNVLFNSGKVTVIRRDSLGRARLTSAANLPISWKAD